MNNTQTFWFWPIIIPLKCVFKFRFFFLSAACPPKVFRGSYYYMFIYTIHIHTLFTCISIIIVGRTHLMIESIFDSMKKKENWMACDKQIFRFIFHLPAYFVRSGECFKIISVSKNYYAYSLYYLFASSYLLIYMFTHIFSSPLFLTHSINIFIQMHMYKKF